LQFRVVIVVTVGTHLPFWSAPPRMTSQMQTFHPTRTDGGYASE